jgi:DNA-binding LacI/PurR family transcriptional regulator
VDKKLLRSLQSGQVDGIILLHYSAAMPDNYEQLTQFDLPVAAVGFAPALELPCFSRINLDHAKFTAAAARKIVSEKLHHLALILPGSDRLYPGSVIIDTLRKQIPSNCRLTIFDPLEPDVSDCDLRNLDSEDLRLALPAFTERLRQWHEQNDWPDGVICCNELLDSELQKFALQHDLPLPDNSHICFDPAPSHRGQNLLSTRLGECAWQTMQAMLAGDKVKKDILISYEVISKVN